MKFIEAIQSAENLLFYIKVHSWQEIAADVAEAYQITLEELMQMPVWGYAGEDGIGAYRRMAEDVCNHVDDYIWLYDRLQDAMSRYVLWQLLCYRLAPDLAFTAAAAEREYEKYADPDIAGCDGNEAVKESAGFIRIGMRGAEFDTLEDARRHVIQDRSRLAVGVGYPISGLWEIPALIDGMMGGCAFFLRHYQADELQETVLYAVSSERIPGGREDSCPDDGDDRPNICVLPAFPLQNVQILKDRMVIPYLYYRHFGRSMTIVTRKTEDYPYLAYLEGVRIAGLEYRDDKSRDYENACRHYLLRNYKKIDILFLYGPYPQYIPIAPFYKFLRPDGKIYLKLDANAFWMDRLPVWEEPYKLMFSSCDVISCESLKLQRLLSKKWPWKIEYIPNGYYDFFSVTTEPVPYSQKENRILTVGRIGTEQKNSEMLLEAFAKASGRLLKGGWRLRLVGSVEPEFHDWVREYFERYPNLKDSVDLTGPIYDKNQLFDEYKKAKIFVLTSRMEGGPNVVSEALASCCVPVMTEIDSSGEATDEGRLGEVVPQEDSDYLARVFTRLCNDENRLQQDSEAAWRYLKRHLDYDKIVERLDLLLRLS